MEHTHRGEPHPAANRERPQPAAKPYSQGRTTRGGTECRNGKEGADARLGGGGHPPPASGAGREALRGGRPAMEQRASHSRPPHSRPPRKSSADGRVLPDATRGPGRRHTEGVLTERDAPGERREDHARRPSSRAVADQRGHAYDFRCRHVNLPLHEWKPPSSSDFRPGPNFRRESRMNERGATVQNTNLADWISTQTDSN